MSEANLRDENSGLWFSPQPPDERVQGARNPDSVLFNLATITAPAEAATPRVPVEARPTDAAGSGLIDVRTLAAAANDPVGARPVPPPAVNLVPTLVSSASVTVEPPPVASSRPLLLAIVGLLVALVGLLGVLALR